MKKRLAALLSLMLIATLVLSVPVFATGDDNNEDPAITTGAEGTETEGTETEGTETEGTETEEPTEGEENGAEEPENNETETPEGNETEVPAFPFEDVAEDAYYYASVKAVYELGLIKGMSDTAFGPAGNLTIAQAIVFAVRMNVYFDDTATEPANAEDGNWYDTYVAYAVEKGIIEADTFEDYTANVTRAQMAFLFVGAVPEMAVVNENAAAPDAEGNAYADSINAFYKAGILQGVDAEGNYNPDNAIVRRDVATIIFRLVDETQRIVPEATDGETEAPTDGEDDAEAPADGETEAPADGETEAPADGETETPADGETEAE